MKRILFILISLSFFYSSSAQTITPKFQGGDIDTFKEWIEKYIRYPYENYIKNMDGKVVVRFVITTSGNLENITIAESTDTLFSLEVIDLLSTCPKWEPGINNGEPKNVNIVIPISFRIADYLNYIPRYIPKYTICKLTAINNPEEPASFKYQDFRSFEEWFSKQFFDDSSKPSYGKISVQFTIGKNGKPSNIKVLEIINPELYRVVPRIIMKCPKWKPAMENSKKLL